jgi:HEAT repeat protein
MDSWVNLIEISQGDNPKARAATAELISAGAKAVPDLIRALRTMSGKSSKSLRNIILRMSDQDAVPVMLSLVDDENIDVMIVAFRFLGQSQSSLAFQTLIERLEDVNNIETKRYLAANALGELGDRRSLPSLNRVAGDSYAGGNFRLAISATVAMAKLGSQETAPRVVDLILTSNDPITRVEASGALKYLFSPKIFAALQLALKDDDLEICRNGIDGLFLLGTKDAASELLRRAKTSTSEICQYIVQRICDITGRDFTEDEPINAVLAWWEREKTKFDSDTCYRLGRPIRVADVIQLLQKTRDRRMAIMGELQIVLGQSFGYSKDVPLDDHEWEKLYARMKQWWEREKDRFEAGGLYKFGIKQRLKDLSASS